MDQLRIHAFGSLVIERGHTLLPAFPTRKAESLFTYLLVNPHRLVHRDVLCGEFWGEQPDTEARKALRTALWRIRSVVESDPADRGTLLRVDGDQVGFAPSDRVWVDVWEMEECMRLEGSSGGELDEATAERLGDAARLYRGDFLEGHYDHWCFLHRERLRMGFLTTLERLLEYHRRRGEWLAAIAWARQLLRYDPLREHIHRALMACHHAMGDRPSALRQYRACVRVLREELEIEPMDETRALYERIRAGRPALWTDGRRAGFNEYGGAEHARSLAAEVNRALEQLDAITERLERTRKALRAEGEHAILPPAS